MSDFLRWMLYGAIGFAGAYIIEAIVKAIYRRFFKEPAEPNELDTLVRQERINQAIPLVTIIATHLPVDVRSVTITLHYSAKESLTMECGRPQRMKVEP